MTEEQGVHAETVAESQGPAQEQSQQEDPNWKAARETMAQQKQELEAVKQQNALLQRWAEQQSAAQQQAAQPANPFEGMSTDDVMTVGDFQGVFNNALEAKEKAFRQEVDTLRREQKLMSYRTQYQDYDNVVQSTLKKAESNPALARAIASSEDPHLLAYELGRADSQQQKKQQAEAQRMLENAQKPGSVSQASTGGSALSAIDHIMGMSDQDFEAKIAAIKRGG